MIDPILYWNDVALEANKEDHTSASSGENQQGPVRSSRALCLTHLAIHDAYFTVNGVATIPMAAPKALYLNAPPTFAGGNTLETRSSAVSGAASSVLMNLYSRQRGMIEDKLRGIAALNGWNSAAFEFGRQVAAMILALRTGDEAMLGGDENYAPSMDRFRHRQDPYNPSQGFAGSTAGKMKTFALSAWQTLAPPPVTAPLGGAPYLANLTEVIRKGGAAALNTTTRTPEETMIGYFWAYDGASKIGTPPRLYNQIVAVVARKMNNTEAENARLFALVNAAMGDSGIAAWHYKYCFDFWRPILGVREHDLATGPAAVADPFINPPCDPYWRPLGGQKSNQNLPTFTPNFPAYPSGHATFGASSLEMMRRFYREFRGLVFNDSQADNISFEFVSDEQDGKTVDSDGSIRTRHKRNFSSLAQAIYENSVSRIFLGVHWRFDGTTGANMNQMLAATDDIGGVPLGRKIAKDIYESGLKQNATPVVAPADTCL
jgi:membrane-associated phospholipid phosphatase